MVKKPKVVGELLFQGKDSGEQFQFYFRQHWIRLLWPLLKTGTWNLLLLFIGYEMFTTGAITDTTARHALALILAFFFLLSQWEFISRFYRYFLYVTIVTDKKVHRIKKTLLAIDMHESVDLWLLQDIIKSQRGIVQNMMGFGSLILEGQNQPLLRIHFTPRIADNYTKLMHLRERARSTLGA